MIGQDRISDGYVTRGAFSESHLSPISETTSHVLLQPRPLFVFVVKSWHSGHLDGPIAISTPDSLERVAVQILLVGGGRSLASWFIRAALQVQARHSRCLIAVFNSDGSSRHVGKVYEDVG